MQPVKITSVSDFLVIAIPRYFAEARGMAWPDDAIGPRCSDSGWLRAAGCVKTRKYLVFECRFTLFASLPSQYSAI
jgi:hypothetical protein